MNTTRNKLSVNYEQGLTDKQVQDQVLAGLSNTAHAKISKTNWEIIRDNVCTLFNLFNIIIAISLALVGAYSNLLFILIVTINVVIGIAQEIHAKNLVEALSLINSHNTIVVRNGLEKKISIDNVVLDDIIKLELGDQVCVDAVIVNGEIEVNESLLTGESDTITKYKGDLLLSGSFVVSGICHAQVEHVGLDNYAVQIANEAKKQKSIHSQLLQSMRKVTKFTAFLIVPLGILLFIQSYLFRGSDMTNSVISTAAALLGMLPKGLVLLISISLASGVIKLSKKNVLVQELFALETLASVDTLCLDKTGTLTHGKMVVQSIVDLGFKNLPISIETLIGGFINNTNDSNATFRAIADYFSKDDTLIAYSTVPFSSERKWSAVTFSGVGSLVIGAPEILSPQSIPDEALQNQAEGSRVLMVSFSPDEITLKSGLANLQSVALIIINDPLRENAASILKYFVDEGVNLKIISGDNPVTVSAIARKVGLPHAEACLDLSIINDEQSVAKSALTHSVFGRVSPQQKKILIKSLQKNGHTVAMTGDGVNDVLALHAADCSIAMAEGSDAAHQVSQLVLMDSNFGSLPDVMREGRRVVNNITRVSSIFFIKTLYSIALSIICFIGNFPFPFLPIQITLIDLAIEAYPSLFISFEPDSRKLQGSFLRTAIRHALPNAIAIVITILATGIIMPLFSIETSHMLTFQYYLIAFITMLAVFRACIPFNKLRIFLCTTMSVGFYVATILFHSILHITLLSLGQLLFFATMAAGCVVLVFLLTKVIDRAFSK